MECIAERADRRRERLDVFVDDFIRDLKGSWVSESDGVDVEGHRR